MASYAGALSEHPIPAHAVGEAVGQVLERLNGAPDFCFLFVTNSHGGAVEDIARSVRRLLNPRVLIGCTSPLVGAGGQHVENVPGIALFAGRVGLEVDAVRLDAVRAADDWLITGGAGLNRNGGTLLMIAEGKNFPVGGLAAHLNESSPGIAIAGGTTDPGPAYLILDDELFTDGAVGLHLPPEANVVLASSPGCRPFGKPMVVTKADGGVIRRLAGETALDSLNAQIDALEPSERELLASGLYVGVVLDEGKEVHEAGDFEVFKVTGADRRVGALALDGAAEEGCTMQFQLPDPLAAAEGLENIFGFVAGAPRFNAHLMFGSTSRNFDYFGMHETDIETANEMSTGPVAIVGCARQLAGSAGSRATPQQMGTTVIRFC